MAEDTRISLRFMLDTNLCIRVLRDKPADLKLRFNDQADSLSISTIVLMELLHGAAKSALPIDNRRAVEDFASRLDVLPFDDQAASHAGDIKAELERAGEVIGAYDILIAGHARSKGLALVTGNLREFQHVRGLVSEDWT